MNVACRHEVHVRRAATEDSWSEALRAHIETCIDCRAAAAIAPAMSQLAAVKERSHVLPEPAVIWLKAQLLRGTAMVEQVSRPLNIMQIVAYIAVAGGWAGMMMWKWKDVTAVVRTFTPESMATGSTAVSLGLVGAIAVLGSMTFALAMHTILAED